MIRSAPLAKGPVLHEVWPRNPGEGVGILPVFTAERAADLLAFNRPADSLRLTG